MKFIYAIVAILLLSCQSTNTEIKAPPPLYDYDVEERIKELGIELRDIQLPEGIPIELAVKHGDLIYLSGNGPRKANGEKVVGKIGVDLTLDQGYEAARLSAISHLSVLKAELGDLNKVVRVVKVLGMVNASQQFVNHPKVINGYSDLMIEVFGERGKHARSAVGMGSLPFNFACEVEAIIQVQE